MCYAFGTMNQTTPPPHAVPADIPVPGPSEVGQGIWSLPVPLPGNPLRYVVPYALEVPGGLVLIDAGWDDDEPWQALQSGLAFMGASPADVRGVLVTHAHPDHYGLAPRIREISGAWIALHPADNHMLAFDDAQTDRHIESFADWLVKMGAPEAELTDFHESAEGFRSVVRKAPPDRGLTDGEAIADVGPFDLLAVHTPGHTDGHVCFQDRGHDLIFTGDHVLPKISPNVSTASSLSANPLGDYLRSLTRTGELGVESGLPAHVEPLESVTARVAELLSHHEIRLGEMRETLEPPGGADLSVFDVASRQPWKRGWAGLSRQMRGSAVGETHAHLLELAQRGQAQAATVDGVERWSRVEPETRP